MNFYTIKARFYGALCSSGKIVNDAPDVVFCHFTRFLAIDHLAIAVFVCNPHLSFHGG